jgi:peptide deformylase
MWSHKIYYEMQGEKMAIRIIRKNGDPVLREAAGVVREITPHVLALLDDMAQTMADADGVGLAAPQVGIGKRLIVVDIREEPGLLKLINPVIIGREGRETAVEGCLSLPGLLGEVERDAKVTVRALTPGGEVTEICAAGLLARALQHEIDHLDGILFVDRAARVLEKKD